MLIGILEELEYWKISVTPVSLFSPRPVYSSVIISNSSAAARQKCLNVKSGVKCGRLKVG